MTTTRQNIGEIHNYALMMRCEGNPEVAKWVEEQNLPLTIDNLTVKTDELNKGLHLTLLFIGDMHALCTQPNEFSKLTADIDALFNEHKHHLFTPLLIDRAAIFGEFQQVIVLKLRQEEDVLKNINEQLKKKLTEQYNVALLHKSKFLQFSPLPLWERPARSDG